MKEAKLWPYTEKAEKAMKNFYASLNEKDRRHYAAVEACRLGHGGIEYIARLLGCSKQTIYAGIEELEKK